MSKCQHIKTSKVVVADDRGDIEQHVCKTPGCGVIVKEFQIIQSGDDTIKRPVGARGPVKKRRGEDPEAELTEVQSKKIDAAQMAEIAEEAQYKLVGRKVEELIGHILDGCYQEAKQGNKEANVLVKEDSPLYDADFIKMAIKELRGIGYKGISKSPEPGKGVWIRVSWKTVKK